MSYVQDIPVWAFLESGPQLGSTSGVNWDALPAVGLGLLVFGIAYSVLIHYLHRHGLNDGYTWLEVVIGVAVTLLAASVVVGWPVVLALAVLFAASGVFVALGDIFRYAQARRAETRGNHE